MVIYWIPSHDIHNLFLADSPFTVDLRWIYHWKNILEKSPIQQTQVHRQFVDAKHVG